VKIVADAGPVIGLAKIGKISLLEKLAEEVLIPPIVHKELFGKIGFESNQIDLALRDFVNVVELGSSEIKEDERTANLGEGEKQCIYLASSLKKDVLLLIDDRAARKAADKFYIPKTGLAGFLIIAKSRGLINNVGSLLSELRSAGYWLSDEVIAVARKLAGE